MTHGLQCGAHRARSASRPASPGTILAWQSVLARRSGRLQKLLQRRMTASSESTAMVTSASTSASRRVGPDRVPRFASRRSSPRPAAAVPSASQTVCVNARWPASARRRTGAIGSLDVRSRKRAGASRRWFECCDPTSTSTRSAGTETHGRSGAWRSGVDLHKRLWPEGHRRDPGLSDVLLGEHPPQIFRPPRKMGISQKLSQGP